MLLFLHADSRPGPGAREALLSALRDPRVIGGSFRVAFVPARRAARLFTTLYDLRRRVTGIYYGDSGIFVRRDTYRRLGGFAPLPLMPEDPLEVHTRTSAMFGHAAPPDEFESTPVTSL